MENFRRLLVCTCLAATLSACDDDNVEIVEIEREVVVTNTVTQVETVNVPTIVTVPAGEATSVQVGARPFFLVEDMDESELKIALEQCSEGPFYTTDFSIGHRGAPLQFPEHTQESYIAASRMGAGILECDVTFTQDQELVCRHSQCDLHTTTDILATDLAQKCDTNFIPADPENGTPAQARCCTSDITLAEFRTLRGKMDASDPSATTVEEYLGGTADFRTDLYASRGTLMTHAESIALFKSLGAKMTPELKSPSVPMPYNGFTQQDYAQKMIDEYVAAEVDPADVFAQSFNLDDVLYWIDNTPQFGEQGVFLDGRYADSSFDLTHSSTWSPTMQELVDHGVQIIAPPTFFLVSVGENQNIVPSLYAEEAKAAGLDIISWSLERSGPLATGGGFYYQTISDITNNDGDQLALLDVLAKEVGVLGVFSDWPGTTTYYASCMGMPPSI